MRDQYQRERDRARVSRCPVAHHSSHQTPKLALRLALISTLISALVSALISGCEDDRTDPQEPSPLERASGVFASPGEIRPNASDEERAIFESGLAVATHRFTSEEGLGPLFNVTFCGGCHEKPTFGGSAGHYRDFYIYGESLGGTGFSPSGPRSGVLSTFSRFTEAEEAREEENATDPYSPTISKITPEAEADLFTRRNPIPFFGIGLLAEIPEDELLSRADPGDQDQDGISGRPNFDQGYVGRFGLKAQTVSIENFIRGPLFNHLGITSDPLSPALQAALPVPSVAEDRPEEELGELESGLTVTESDESDSETPQLGVYQYHQAAAPSEPLTDSDDAPDPELSEEDLFSLVSWAMLLAAPLPDPLDEISTRGEGLFHAFNCSGCHTPALRSPRGLIHAYTDLLLHDMGPELADGVVMALASGSEFRTQPLWGVSATGPYLYDGRAHTLDEAIALHGGEATLSRDAYLDATPDEREALIYFLESLGGRDVKSEGLLPPNSPLELGDARPIGPRSELNDEDRARFERGRALYDHDFGVSAGLGPLLNGDSCRGCHFEPALGGSGPTGVSAVRQLIHDVASAEISEEARDGHLMRRFNLHGAPPAPVEDPIIMEDEPNRYEVRQALPSFGLGILNEISEEAILGNEDPEDLDGDGIRGVARRVVDGRVGRFGWRAQLPDLREFIADALSFELGLTLPEALGLSAAITSDDDDVADPELDRERFEALYFFLLELAPPRVEPASEDEQSARDLGESIFVELGCARCHIPKLEESQSLAAYTDLLLHAVQPEDTPDQLGRRFRTPPLWGVGLTGTYWHDGRASTLWDAINTHGGEASASRERALELSGDQREALLSYLESL